MLDIDKKLQQTEPDCSEGLGNKNFLLRQPAQADLDMLVASATNPVLAKNLCSNWLPTSSRAADLWFASHNQETNPTDFPFVLTDMKGNYLGTACLMLQEERTQAEISIMICRDKWQNGYATRAIQALADFAFSNPNQNHPKLQTVTAQCRVSCRKSRRIVEKCGFQYSGTGMAQSPHYRGMIPIDRYHLDRGIWTAIRHWAGASHMPIYRNQPTNQPLEVKGAA
ncbi:GNAT family N-acetyltransferase [Cohaesibacter celericrescens]|uniref:N-acetyltransferase domain-containing protein n=1 Tax=Cohaesibacter celericrescens TaxID=2067669 RepID=A0A2N5XPR5_9HYPH|nr:GNAT family N-acetyltransferase [Cohaesibacter celericrescens]PLW76420.1 hypothetical protein C0081_16210 [Cohaesibacter celericrescens]